MADWAVAGRRRVSAAMIPQRVGRYQIQEAIGRGAAGEVYRALDADLERVVAVKFINPGPTTIGEEGRQRFRREVRAAAHLNHPNIVTIYDVGLDHEPPYVVMEYLPGGSIRSLFEEGPLEWPAALALLQPIGAALDYAHEAGIVHRDVKPGNILLSGGPAPVPKLVDFGLVQWLGSDRLTKTGGILGTAAYMSPEQANEERLDGRSDLFSLGLILFEALTGRNPLRGRTFTETLSKAASYEPIDLSPLVDRAPDHVVRIVEQALARNRRERYRQGRRMVEDMARSLALQAPAAARWSTSWSPAPVAADAPRESMAVDNLQGVDLPPGGVEILAIMFADYGRLAIKDELGGGFSGSRIFVVRPIRNDGTPELPAVVKMAPVRLIQQEWAAYHHFVRDQLPGIAQIRGDPVLPVDAPWGGLRYQMVGGGEFQIESLATYARDAPAADLRFVLVERLFKRLGPFWRFNFPAPEFHLAPSYDHLLPVNLLLRPAEPPPEATVRVIRAGEPVTGAVVHGDHVRLTGFVVAEREDEGRTITLNWPREADPGSPPASYRVRLERPSGDDAFQVGQVIDALDGQVTNTRTDILQGYLLELFGWDFDPQAEQVTLPGGEKLPNPVARLPAILGQTLSVRLASVHGDLNPENILVDPETRDVRLIDFATARRDHALQDLLRLETGILTHMVPDALRAGRLPAIFAITIVQELGRFTDGTQATPPHAAVEKPYAMLVAVRQMARNLLFDPGDWREYYQGLTLILLGALKYRNLDRPAKKIAFWAAAAVQRLIDNPPALRDTEQQEPEREAPAPAAQMPVESSQRIEPGPAPPAPRPWPRRQERPWLARLPLVLVVALAAVFLGLLLAWPDNEPEATGPDGGQAAAVAPAETATPTLRPSATRRPTPRPTARPSATRPPEAPLAATPATLAPLADEPLVVAILLDTSTAMVGPRKIENALLGVTVLLERLEGDDRVLLYTYGGEVRRLAAGERAAEVRDELEGVLGGLFADGQPLLFDALCQAAGDLEVLLEPGEDGADRPLATLVLLAGGGDVGAGQVQDEAAALGCLGSEELEEPWPVLAIAYEEGADAALLERLATATGGQFYSSTQADVVERLAAVRITR